MHITNIAHEISAEKGRYVAMLADSQQPAQLLYKVASPAVIIAEHTETPLAVRGQGIALALVRRMVDDARCGGYRVMPMCSYIRAQFQLHPEWGDVLQD